MANLSDSRKFNSILGELHNLIDGLEATPCPLARNILFDRLKFNIWALSEFAKRNAFSPESHALQQGQLPQQDYSLAELSRYDGQGGRPAYIAVNGLVYDVTNNAAWAAATHFGLTAGKDHTAAFNSCHGREPTRFLSRLTTVGRLI